MLAIGMPGHMELIIVLALVLIVFGAENSQVLDDGMRSKGFQRWRKRLRR